MRSACAGLFALALVGCARATVKSSDAANGSQELMMAMIATGFGRSTGHIVGKAPPGYPAELIPRGELLGGFTNHVFVRSRAEYPKAVENFLEQFGTAGFKEPSERPTMEVAGFQATRPRPASRGGGQLCRDSTSLLFGSAVRPGGGTYLVVRLLPMTPSSPCHSLNADRISQEMQIAPPTLPLLYAPAGLTQRNSGYGSSGEAWHASAVYDGPGVYTDSVMFAYTVQLKEQGWGSIQLLGGGEWAALSAQKPGARGHTIALTIVDMRSNQRVHFITMQNVILR